jgi:hypothetical protein
MPAWATDTLIEIKLCASYGPTTAGYESPAEFRTLPVRGCRAPLRRSRLTGVCPARPGCSCQPRPNFTIFTDFTISQGQNETIEIISKESRGRDTLDKRDDYERSGVREYWLVDPERRELTVFRRKGQRLAAERLRRGRCGSVVLPGLALEGDWLWRKPLPNLYTVLGALHRESTADPAGEQPV